MPKELEFFPILLPNPYSVEVNFNGRRVIYSINCVDTSEHFRDQPEQLTALVYSRYSECNNDQTKVDTLAPIENGITSVFFRAQGDFSSMFKAPNGNPAHEEIFEGSRFGAFFRLDHGEYHQSNPHPVTEMFKGFPHIKEGGQIAYWGEYTPNPRLERTVKQKILKEMLDRSFEFAKNKGIPEADWYVVMAQNVFSFTTGAGIVADEVENCELDFNHPTIISLEQKYPKYWDRGNPPKLYRFRSS